MSLAAEGLRLRLGGKAVLDGVDATLKPGEVTAVLGPNGAGKSTLLGCLAGLRRPDAGRVLLDGAPLAGLAPRARARRIGFLPQSAETAWPIGQRHPQSQQHFRPLSRGSHSAVERFPACSTDMSHMLRLYPKMLC